MIRIYKPSKWNRWDSSLRSFSSIFFSLNCRMRMAMMRTIMVLPRAMAVFRMFLEGVMNSCIFQLVVVVERQLGDHKSMSGQDGRREHLLEGVVPRVGVDDQL